MFNTMNLSSYERVPPLDCYQSASNPLVIADRMIEKCTAEDNALPQLIDKLNITSESKFVCVSLMSIYITLSFFLFYPFFVAGPTTSGLAELEYVSTLRLSDTDGSNSINQFKLINKIPLPPEIVEQCGCILLYNFIVND